MTPSPLRHIIQTLLDQLDETIDSTLDDLRRKLIALLAEVERNPQRIPIFRAQLLQLLRTYPNLLQQVIAMLRTPADAAARERSKGIEPVFESMSVQASSVPATVTRYTDIACPRRIWVETPRVTAVVRLTRERTAFSTDAEGMEVRTDKPVLVQVVAPAFRVLGAEQKPLTILPEADSETSFDLKPLGMTGQADIRFYFVQGGNPVGTASVTVEIVEMEVAASTERTAAQLLRWQPGAAPPDLMLYVAHEYLRDKPHLIFTLYEQGSAQGRTFDSVQLAGDAQSLTQRLYQRLTQMAEQAAKGHNTISPAQVERGLRQIGQSLWQNVIPYELKELYTEKHAAWQGRSLLLISDEPHIPWELVWPADSKLNDANPWGVTLRLTRWLRCRSDGRDNVSPPSFINLSALASVMPKSSYLAMLTAEETHLKTLLAQHKIGDCSPAAADLDSVLALLAEGAYQWLHVSTHGNFDAADPNYGAELQLDEDTSLTPEDFWGHEVLAHIDQTRPGFVFNACHVGQQSWALTGMGGWASHLIGLGAGLFIAPLWAVGDTQALAFTQGFYDALLGDKTVAAAVHAGRMRAYRKGDPTWLAYSVYAHPNARLRVNSK